MNENIFDLINEHATVFSKGQKRISAYILAHFDKAALMTARDLGKTVGVSESTIVRFATELGYSGFPEMQKAMQKVLINQLPARDANRRFNYEVKNPNLVMEAFQNSFYNLEQAVASVDKETFLAAVEHILNNKRLFVLGARTSSVLANYTGQHLTQIMDVHVITESDFEDILERLLNIGSGDCILAYCLYKYSSAVPDVLSYCHENGASVILISDDIHTASAQFCDCFLRLNPQSLSLFYSMIGPIGVVDALLKRVLSEKSETMRHNANKLEIAYSQLLK